MVLNPLQRYIAAKIFRKIVLFLRDIAVLKNPLKIVCDKDPYAAAVASN